VETLDFEVMAHFLHLKKHFCLNQKWTKGHLRGKFVAAMAAILNHRFVRITLRKYEMAATISNNNQAS
jgi:hypothetical protein